MSVRTPRERLPLEPNISRVHKRSCPWLQGSECDCEPSYYVRIGVGAERRARTFYDLERARHWRTEQLVALGKLPASYLEPARAHPAPEPAPDPGEPGPPDSRSWRGPIPVLLLNQKEAAAALGISVNTFRLRVRPYIRHVTIGTAGWRFPLTELQRWIEDNAERLDETPKRPGAR